MGLSMGLDKVRGQGWAGFLQKPIKAQAHGPLLKAKVIVVPPWDSPATGGSPAGLVGVAGTIISPSLLSGS